MRNIRSAAGIDPCIKPVRASEHNVIIILAKYVLTRKIYGCYLQASLHFIIVIIVNKFFVNIPGTLVGLAGRTGVRHRAIPHKAEPATFREREITNASAKPVFVNIGDDPCSNNTIIVRS